MSQAVLLERQLAVCVAGVDGVGSPVSEICHRPDRYAELAGISTECQVTPEAVAAVLNAESLHDLLLINKVEDPSQWQLAERIALRCKTPVVAGSLRTVSSGACDNPGAGDIATAIAFAVEVRYFVVMTEIEQPLTARTTAAFSGRKVIRTLGGRVFWRVRRAGCPLPGGT